MIKRYSSRFTNKFSNRINERISAPNIRVLDDQGKQVGILNRLEAISLAKEKGVDLVEIAPNAEPPVAKIIDYNKFLYQLKKKKQEEKKKAVVSVTKELRMGPFIGEHDLEIKLNKAKEFFKEGHKVKFTIRFQGRQMGKQDLGKELLKKIIERLSDTAKTEREIHMEGRQMAILMSRIK